MNLAPIRNALISWLNQQGQAISGPNFRAILEDQSDVRPALPYASLKITGVARVDGVDGVRQESPGVFTQERMRSMTVSINVFAIEAQSILATILSTLDQESVINAFTAVGFSHYNDSEIRDLSALEAKGFQVRAQSDVDFYIVDSTVVSLGEIDHANVVFNGTD